MILAWRNLLHDRVRLAVTVIGVAFAVFLMLFEGSLLVGFLSAASGVVDATDADLWITARGVPCFDFPAPLPARFRELALSVSGVSEVHRIATSFAAWKKPDGTEQTVIVVGADPAIAGRLPRPPHGPDAVVVDRSDLDSLGVDSLPSEVEMGARRARLVAAASGFGSFLGSPYVFASHADAADYVGIDADRTTFLLARVAPGRDPAVVVRALRARLPETEVWTRDEFSRRSRAYWVLQTGAGGAILTAGLLGFLVGAVIVSQTIYATTMENLEEFATLKAMGASGGFIRGVVLTQALASGAIGYVAGMAAAVPALAGLRGAIAWVRTPWWLPLLLLLVALAMCAAASVVSVRAAIRVEPARVFRA